MLAARASRSARRPDVADDDPICAKLGSVGTTSGDRPDVAGDPAASWLKGLTDALTGSDSAEQARRFNACLPPGYQERTTPEEAAADIDELRALKAATDHAGSADARVAADASAAADTSVAADTSAADASKDMVTLLAGRRFGGRHRLVVRPQRDREGEAVSFRLRRFGAGGVELSGFLPVLESFGLVVAEAVPFRLAWEVEEGRPAHIDDFGVRPVGSDNRDEAPAFDPMVDGPRLVTALDAVAHDRCDIDSLNRLVTLAGLEWTQVMVLRAYRRYWRQTATALAEGQLDDPLAAHPGVSRALIDYFETRFHPARSADMDLAAAIRKRILLGLDDVAELEHDRVLRGYLALIDATLRTTYFRPDGLTAVARSRTLGGAGRGTLTLKFDSAKVPDLPAPRPLVETWVHGPKVEGIHLRAGLVARGGIRWSERKDDLRTEVLDLATAQVKKNAIIVPTGAKGGFVCRQPASPLVPEVQAAYEAFVGSLLDLTDNLVGSEVVPPDGVIAHDGHDPYLVVAADKGTATFSDVANSLSEARGFWLGDAFASGGSHGYDHKAMGITAKGAWVAVRRHFHQLGIDVQTEPIRVVGVGDMSGDVFGNGMLRTSALQLIAAFDHRHIFVDPNPDPAISFAERHRIARLERSSWADYDAALISPGGGVWPRTAKRISLSDAARSSLGIEGAEMSPSELISALLMASVDLLFFGGIGTYIKAPDESDVEVGDHVNDALRITSNQVRARVITEGGNLGVTQTARIRYSRRGGRINTDFIDNAAGVATSDQEVNLKILLTLAAQVGQLDPAERDVLLSSCQEDVAAAVLRQVDHSVAALNRAVPASATQLDAYEALLEDLEGAGRLDRTVEDLPSAEELAVRRRAGAGLIRPELAVLLAYAKSHLVAAIEDSSLSRDNALEAAVQHYFPVAIRDRFGSLVRQHRLYPQLLATNLAGEIVDQMGVVWAHETAAEMGRDIVDVAGAFWAARQVLDAGTLFDELEAQSASIDANAEQDLHQLVTDAVGALARSYLRQAGPIEPDFLVTHDRPLAEAIVAAGRPGGPSAGRSTEDALVAQGVNREMAARFVGQASLARLGDASEISREVKVPLGDVVETLAGIDRASGVDRLEELIFRIPLVGRWPSWQARALLDDIAAWRRVAVHEALASTPRLKPQDAVAAWEKPRSAILSRTGGLLAQLDPEGTDALTLASLIVRNLGRAQAVAEPFDRSVNSKSTSGKMEA